MRVALFRWSRPNPDGIDRRLLLHRLGELPTEAGKAHVLVPNGPALARPTRRTTQSPVLVYGWSEVTGAIPAQVLRYRWAARQHLVPRVAPAECVHALGPVYSRPAPPNKDAADAVVIRGHHGVTAREDFALLKLFALPSPWRRPFSVVHIAPPRRRRGLAGGLGPAVEAWGFHFCVAHT